MANIDFTKNRSHKIITANRNRRNGLRIHTNQAKAKWSEKEADDFFNNLDQTDVQTSRTFFKWFTKCLKFPDTI